MPSVTPSQLRSLAETLARAGRIDQQGVEKLIDTALGDDVTLAPELSDELGKILVDFGDKLESGNAKRKLTAFLDTKDRDLQALARRAEGNDGVIRASEAKKLVAKAAEDGTVTADEKFSLAAVLVGSTMTSAARAHVAAAAQLEEVMGTRAPRAEIAHGALGLKDAVTIDAEGTIAGVSVDVAIAHERRGDLTLRLVAPDGTAVLLSDRQGGTKDDIRGAYPTKLKPKEALDVLLGKPAKGDWTLELVDHAGKHVGTLERWALKLDVRKDGTPEAGTGHAFTPAGFDRPAHLSSTGHVVLRAGDDKPASIVERGDALFNLADLIDDSKDNPLAAPALTVDQKRHLFTTLGESLALAPASGPAPSGLDEAQTLQLRSSTVTVMRALLEGLGDSSDERALKEEIFRGYRDALLAETNPMLRDSMIFHLGAARNAVPSALRAEVDTLVREIAPLSPPYDDWFKGQDRTLRISWATGREEEFSLGTMKLLEKKGFTKADPSRTSPPLVYSKTMNGPGGEPHTIEVHLKVNRNDIFDAMDDDKFHVVGYDGHSDIGRNIPASLRGAPDESGKKLIFYGLCAGKDNLGRVREKYPDAQVITTFNSSYFNTAEENGRTVMTRSENFNVLMELVEGSVKRSDWKTINQNIKDRAVLFSWHHPMPGGTNYISPAHTEIRRKVLDTDHDGQADILDKLVTFNSYKVAEDTAREFEPRPPGRKADLLDGTRTHIAAQALNTATGYNTESQDYKRQNIIGDGYFEPTGGDTRIVRFERAKIDGQDVLKMKVNSHYAHMSVEALRAVAHYAFFQEIGAEQGLNDVDRKLMGLVFATFSINYDEARWSRDNQIWSGLLAAMNLPPDLPLDPIKSLIDAEHHDYAGNMTHVREWKSSIPAAALEKLKDPAVG